MTAIALYARPTPGFEERVRHAAVLLARAAEQHAGHIVHTTSLGAEDMVITDLISRNRLLIAVATLDTGRLHPQTVELMSRLEGRYNLRIKRMHPAAKEAQAFDVLHGPLPMRQSVELRKACCHLRKVEPLSRLLQGQTAWVTGLRREQSSAREDVPFETLDDQGRSKLSPLADWSWADVWHYIALHQVPTNPLHDEFFPSIGCQPCTRAVAVGEDPRAGRWWWESDVKECGLHVKGAEISPLSSPSTASSTSTRI